MSRPRPRPLTAHTDHVVTKALLRFQVQQKCVNGYADQSRQPRTQESRLADLTRQRRDECLLAFGAVTGPAAVLRNMDRPRHDFDLLHEADRLLQKLQLSSAVRATIEGIIPA